MADARGAAAGEAEQPREGDTIARGALFAFAAKLSGAAFTAGLTIFLARRLGAVAFGVFSLGLSIVALVDLASDFGVAVALPRFLAEERANLSRVRELVADGIRLELIGSLLVGGGLAALAGPIARAYHAPGLALPLRALAIALLCQNFFFFFGGVFAGLRRQAFALLAGFIEGATEFTASVALVLIAGGASAAAFGRAIGYIIGAGAMLVLAIRLLGVGILPMSPSSDGHVRRILGYAGTLWIVDSVYTVFQTVDSLLIGALLSAGSVAFFQAPMRLISALQYPGYAIATAVSPRLVRSPGKPPDAGAFHRAVRLIIVLAIGMSTVTTVWATPIIHFSLGHGYGPAAGVLRALGPYVLLSAAGALVSTALNYLGGARRRIPIAVATVIVNLVLDLILIPEIGVVGGAVGSDVGIAVYVVAQFRYCIAMLELPLRRYLVILARSFVAALPMALSLAVIGTGNISLLGVLGGGIAGILEYAAALVAVGEVSDAEVSSVMKSVRRVLARAR